MHETVSFTKLAEILGVDVGWDDMVRDAEDVVTFGKFVKVLWVSEGLTVLDVVPETHIFDLSAPMTQVKPVARGGNNLNFELFGTALTEGSKCGRRTTTEIGVRARYVSWV